MEIERGDQCPHQDCQGILRLDKSSGKNFISCDCHPTRHYEMITPQQAASWERGEIVDVEFDCTPKDDNWYRELFLSHSERAA